ncbi:hypothetical protein ACS0TY_035917 [Phlomoides rotata]
MEDQASNSMNTVYLVINCIILAFGIGIGPLVMRQYYLAGGDLVWFASWLETGGWPVMFIPLLINYLRRRKEDASAKLFFIDMPLFVGSAVLGSLTGFDDYMYAYGVGVLPVSTSSILIATQLAFMAIFAYILCKLKFTAFSVNAVVLLTLGAVVLGLHSKADRPHGITNREYWIGFLLVLAAAVLYGFILPAVELMYKKSKQQITYTLVMETQMVMCVFATLVCSVGMIFSKGFQKIPKEASGDKHGAVMYYVVVTCSALVWQCFFLGAVGVVHYSSSLLSGIIIAAALPLTEVLAVIIYDEKFQPEKGLSLFLSLWGFASYFWGEKQQSKKNKSVEDQDRSDHSAFSTSV